MNAPRGIWIGVALGVILVGSGGAYLAMRRHAASASPPAASVPSPPSAGAPRMVWPSPDDPSAGDTASEGGATAAPPPSGANGRPVLPHGLPTRLIPPPTRAARCTPPWELDANGARRMKSECQ